jgi:serine/threonine protein kinase
VQLSEPAAPAAAAAPGAGRIAAAAPPAKPAAAPAAQAPEQQAIHQQQQQQQQQKRKKKKRQQQEQQLAAEATNGAVGLGDMTAGEELQLWLFDVAASPVSMPLVYQKYLSAGGQAGVLLVEQRVQQEWHKSLQASGWQAGQPPLTWAALPALCATSSGAGAPSAGAAAAAATGRGAAAAAAASPPELRALKVGLPFRPQKQGESIATWERKRIAHMDKIGKALWREHTLLTRAHSNKPARFDCLVQTYAYGAVKLPTCEYPLPALLLEYCPEGSLDRHLSEPRSPGQPPEPGLTYETARELMQTVCRAVKHLHGQHIVHRDIKCSNVLLVKGGGGKLKAKLADLGMALDFMDGHPSNDVVFSGYYCPPEIEEQQFHDVRSDSWLVGALLLHMRTAELPWLYMFKRTGSLAGRGAGELDNPDSPYFKLEKDEKEVLRLCLAPFGKRLPLRDIMAKFPQYLGC